MVVINALRDALSMLREQPVLFVPMALFGLLQAPQLFTNTLDPLISIAVSLAFTAVFAFVTPVFYGGTIGMADDAATGTRTSLSRFWTHAKENYVSVLAGYLLIFAVSFGFSFLIGVGGFFAFAVVLGTDAGLGVTLAVGAVVALVTLLYLVGIFTLHFYAHAIVIEGYSATGGLSRSVSVVRHNVPPVLGYGVISIGVSGLIGGVYGLIVAFVFPTGVTAPASTPGVVPLVLVAAGTFLLTALLGTLFIAFSVTLYRSMVDADAGSDSSGLESTGAGTGADTTAELAG